MSSQTNTGKHWWLEWGTTLTFETVTKLNLSMCRTFGMQSVLVNMKIYRKWILWFGFI